MAGAEVGDSGLRKQGGRLAKIVILNLVSRLLYLVLILDIIILAFALGTGGKFWGRPDWVLCQPRS